MQDTATDDARETWRLVVRGRVQGVGYRDACSRCARRLGVAGWVRNRHDGSVELMLQGSPDVLAQMRDWLPHGVFGARVDAVEVSVLPRPFERLNGFERLPSA